MPQHGVTTVLIGNCSLGLAPVKPADRAAQLDVFSYIEDVPLDVLERAIPWQWESFPEYIGALDRQSFGVNLAMLVGHSQIRCFVMGEAAWERAATDDEIEAMCRELEIALEHGALGLSFSLFDKDREGRAVPSCLARDEELDALCAVLGSRRAIFQFVPRGDTTEMVIEDMERIGAIVGPHGVVALHNIVVHVDGEPGRSGEILACLERLRDQGVKLYSMTSPRPFELSIGFDGGLCLIAVPAWNRFVQAPRGEKARMLDDPEWRAQARADADSCVSVLFPFSRPHELRIGEVGSTELEQWRGRTLAELVAERGGHVSDVLADWIAENDFDTSFVFAIANTDHDRVATLLKHPRTFVSGSDAGAHLQHVFRCGRRHAVVDPLRQGPRRPDDRAGPSMP